MLARKSLLLPLAVKRHLGPFERPISVAERAGAVLPGLSGLHAFGVAKGVGVLDLAADLLFVVLAQAVAVLDVIGERMKGMAVGFQQTRDGTQCSKGFALTVGGQQADRFANLGSKLARQCHG